MTELIMYFIGLFPRLLNFLRGFEIIPGVSMFDVLTGSAILLITIRQLVIGTQDGGRGGKD
jgi:hypothetical protein